MTQEQKISKVRLLIPSGTSITDDVIIGYLEMAKQEIISAMYGVFADDYQEIPMRYEITQCTAVAVGLGVVGGIGESAHSENGVSRNFAYSDMVDYIRSHVLPVVEVR